MRSYIYRLVVSEKLAYETSYPVDSVDLGQRPTGTQFDLDTIDRIFVWLLRGLVAATDAVSHDGAAQPDPTTHSWQRATS